MAGNIQLRLRLATARSRAVARVASLHRRSLGLQRRRLDLGLRRIVRLGDLSLRTLGEAPSGWLGLGAGRRMGAGLGLVALEQGLRRLGAVAAGSALRS